MRIAINKSAGRLFKYFLSITIGTPILVIVGVRIFIFLGGFIKTTYKPEDILFLPVLFFYNAYFTPAHFIFGDYFVWAGPYGMTPRGVWGCIATIIFYVGASYLMANLVGFIVGKWKTR